MPTPTRYQRDKMRRKEAREFDRANGPVPDHIKTLAGSNPSQMNAALRGGMARDFGQQSDRTKVSLRNKKNHDDALARQERFIQQWREWLFDDAWPSTRLARKIKTETHDPRKLGTIENVVGKARKRMRAPDSRTVIRSSKLTPK